MPQKQRRISRALKCAFPHTIPIFAGFCFLGMTYGIYMKVSGFHSAPHFFRTFQRITGMTPAQYRNSVKGAKSAEEPPL